MSDGDQRISRMNGCAFLGKGIIAVMITIFVSWLLLNLKHCVFLDRGKGGIDLLSRNEMRGLRAGLESYEIEYGQFPINLANKATDFRTTSRGMMLSSLLGQNPQTNKKGIVFCEFRMARQKRHGIWQEGTIWILSDWWGHDYHVLIDNNNDGRIANPETEAIERLPFLPIKIAIFSAGPDGDPATWEDNIKSWE